MIGSPRSRASTLEEVAYHEAGHVVIGHRLGLELASVDILRDREGGNGHTVFNPPTWFRPSQIRAGGEVDERSRDFIERVVITFLAGSLAEARVAGFHNTEASGYDLDAVAREWMGLLVPRDQVDEHLAELNDRAQALVDQPENWAAIERVAKALLERHRMTGDEALAAIIAG